MTRWWNQIRTVGAAAAVAALAVSATTLLAAEGGPGAEPGDGDRPQVSVAGKGSGAYRIDGSFLVDTPDRVAWAVLTDYDNLSLFVSSMRSSAAERRESGRLLVSQEAVGRAGPFARRLHVVLDVTERPPGRIEFRDICGASFRSYIGAWTIEADGNGSRVTYVLEARPRSAPPFFARSILASNARRLLEQVRGEMVRRGRAAPAS